MTAEQFEKLAAMVVRGLRSPDDSRPVKDSGNLLPPTVPVFVGVANIVDGERLLSFKRNYATLVGFAAAVLDADPETFTLADLALELDRVGHDKRQLEAVKALADEIGNDADHDAVYNSERVKYFATRLLAALE